MPVSMYGRSKPSNAVDTFELTSAPPSSAPRMIEPTVAPSIQPLAIDQLFGRQKLGEDAVLRR